MINKNFWDLLAEKQDSLTKSGTIIADYLTKHAEEAQFLSISSLAKLAIWQKPQFTVSVNNSDLKVIMK